LRFRVNPTQNKRVDAHKAASMLPSDKAEANEDDGGDGGGLTLG
jgi:hypothetical protein